MWFDNWPDVLRVLLVGAAAYAFLVLVVRVFGKRTLTQLNAFDFVVTVALGSTLATIILSSDVSWTEGAIAMALLVVLQYAVSRLRRSRAGRAVLTADPTLLVRDGVFLDDQIARHRLTHADIRQTIRSSGVGDLGDVAAVILENDGSMSVITGSSLGDGSVLEDVPGWARQHQG
ncbi:DUF421 domain-containing protein [Dietzia cinnamea]|uniref:DUF421 domain-containing protein n=1 Tax=Dietzia cinnamea TaxID=321318 RepID=UPI00223C108C|nr:YetF domain-containing protein [Dietzia cinnamea]MCT2265185.1 DUF421 domain-containing protein [Dietzia cinnamea]